MTNNISLIYETITFLKVFIIHYDIKEITSHTTLPTW